MVGIKGAFGLAWCAHQLLGKGPRNSEEGRTQAQAGEECSAVVEKAGMASEDVCRIHKAKDAAGRGWFLVFFWIRARLSKAAEHSRTAALTGCCVIFRPFWQRRRESLWQW